MTGREDAPDGTAPEVVHGTLTLDLDGDGVLHATCKCNDAGAFAGRDRAGDRAAATAWWERHLADAASLGTAGQGDAPDGDTRPDEQDVAEALAQLRTPDAMALLNEMAEAPTEREFPFMAVIVRAALAGARPSVELADLVRLGKALDSLNIPRRDGEDEPEFNDGQRWMLTKVSTALRRIHESGVSPGADTWYRVGDGWRRDGVSGGSFYVQDDSVPGFGPDGPGASLGGDVETRTEYRVTGLPPGTDGVEVSSSRDMTFNEADHQALILVNRSGWTDVRVQSRTVTTTRVETPWTEQQT